MFVQNCKAQIIPLINISKLSVTQLIWIDTIHEVEIILQKYCWENLELLLKVELL